MEKTAAYFKSRWLEGRPMNYLLIRMGCAFLTGVLLSQSGSLVQLSTRNILSSPSTLGLDGMSVLLVLLIHSLSLVLGVHLHPGLIALAGIPVAISIGYFYPRFIGADQRFERILLIGITFNLFVGAIFSFWQFLFLAFNLPFPVELWFGHFRFASSNALLLMLIVQILVLVFLRKILQELMLYSFGVQISRNWQLDQKKLFLPVFILATLVTYFVIVLFGAFSFLALVFPIISRKIWFKRSDLKGELYQGALLNGLLLMLVDYLCYQLPIFGAEVPVGLIITAIGAVSLVVLLWQSHKPVEIVANP
jgi:ABC-type Fe3+-siderophore transport system permease subunit